MTHKKLKSAIHVAFLSCHSRGDVFLDVIGNAVIVAVLNCPFKDLLYLTWLSVAYINHRVAPRSPTVKEAGQQHSADQNDSEKLLSGVESQDDKVFSVGFLYSPCFSLLLCIQQMREILGMCI